MSDRRRRRRQILELSQLSTELHGRGLRPRSITPTPGGPERAVTEVLETEQVKRSIFKNEIWSVHESRTSQVMLAVIKITTHARFAKLCQKIMLSPKAYINDFGAKSHLFGGKILSVYWGVLSKFPPGIVALTCLPFAQPLTNRFLI